MNDVVAERVETKPEVKAEKFRVRNRLLRVPTLKVPMKPVDGKYTIHYVTSAGKARSRVSCTKQVYDWLHATRSWNKVHSDWVLTIDPSTDTVVHVTEAPRPSTTPGFHRVTDGKPLNKNVILTLHGDGSVRLKELPDKLRDSVANDIQNAVADYEGEIHAGSELGKFKVMEKHEVLGAVELHIDPGT